MRTMLRLLMDTPAGNAAIANRDVQNVIQRLVETIKPEAAYFYPSEGRRCAVFVFDMAQSSDIPAILEPLFINLGADVDLTPVMNLDDLRTGLAALPA
jgi:hypothetical protein